MFLKLNKRGQSTLEYALLIGIIVAALIAMQVYMKRGVQGKLRDSTDQIGDQYSPGYTTGTVTTNTQSTTHEVLQNKVTTSDMVKSQDQNSNESVASSDQEYWK
ncbi:MAG: hypothetical protein PHJ00_01525 [Candidatus Omnitrophica bacterium]|jgi:uncharacterized protein (UPF0333 family)|nr:hypothetical protein [Candidatus Omnitrophota bacterium]MDD5654774.1 hypothetical protein [Candidatus Omnitrophota bacterium]